MPRYDHLKRFATISILLLIIAISLSLAGCKKSTSDDNNNTPDTPDAGSGLVFASCGIVENQQYAGTNSDSAIEVSILDILLPDLVIIQREGATGPELIQILGITTDGVSNAKKSNGIDYLESNLRSSGFFVPAGNCPVTVAGGGTANLGQIFLSSGQNVAEALIANGSVFAEDNGCGAANVIGCYASIPVQEQISDDTVSSFLWKPVSDKTGKLAVLVDPFQVDIRVNGERLVDTGPGNGKGTNSRGSKPGCAYGSNVRVEFFDSQERRILVANGNRSITVANGCNRVEAEF